MVDINNLYENDFGNCLLSSPCNDYLENIDENDLINFNSNSFESSAKFFIETPPKTPVNYSHIGNFNKDNIISTITVNTSTSSNENPLDFNGNNSIPFQPTITVNCISTPELINANDSNLNGYLDYNSILNHKVFDNCHISKNNIQPKIILPNKVFDNKLKEKEKEILKKQKFEARKLRNREAALNSRLKKKQYIENLESQVNKLNKENNELLLENALLKQKINDLEQDLFKIKNLDINGNYEANRKARISFFAVLLMICFQISPYLMSISPGGKNTTITSKNPSVKSPSTHFSRTLLWNSKGISSNDYFKFQDSSFNVNKSKCDDFYNQTEVIRLENELRGWLTRFKMEENESKRRLNWYRSKQNTKKLLYDLKHVPIPRLKLWMQKQRYIDHINDELDQSFDQFFSYDFESLMSMLHRRDDTFYYLSYPSKGHLILPQMSNRSDIRPRFSFLIPTFYNFSLNSSVTKNENQNETALSIPQLFMLQIDCQVINTKVTLVNVDSHHFSNKTNVPLQHKKLRLFKNRNNK